MKKLHFWCLPFLLYIFYYFFFVYPFAFNYEVDKNGQYHIAFVAFSGWLLFTFCCLFTSAAFNLGQLLCLFIATAVSVLLTASNYYGFSNEYLICVTLSFLFFSCLLWGNVMLLKGILLFFTGAFFVQLFIAADQIWHAADHVQGSLQNSGIFSCYLVVQLPFLYYVLFDWQELWRGVAVKGHWRLVALIKNLLFGAIVACVVILICKLGSRTAMIALSILLFFVLLLYGKNYITRFRNAFSGAYLAVFYAVIVVAVAGGGWYLFYWKKLSAYGRMLMVQVAWEYLPDFFFTGTGLGRFMWYYPQWQAAYFAAHHPPADDYFLSAGDSFIIFNEYLQLFESVGVLGFIVFVWLLILFFRTTAVEDKGMLRAARLTVIAILGCGFTSYPLHVNIMLLLLSFCFAIAAVLGKSRQMSWLGRVYGRGVVAGRVFGGAAMLSAALAVYNAGLYWQAKQEWDMLRNEVTLSGTEAKAEYMRLFTLLKNDGKFLNEYGMFLCEEGSADYAEGIEVLETAKQYFISRAGIETLAGTYCKTGFYKEAEELYIWLDNYVPNRFSAKQALLRIYCEKKDTARAIKVAEKMLTMPVKISSVEVDRAKAGAREVLSRLAGSRPDY